MILEILGVAILGVVNGFVSSKEGMNSVRANRASLFNEDMVATGDKWQTG